MLQRICVNRLTRTAMHRQVGLPVAIQIEFAEGDRTVHRHLEDGRADALAHPDHFTRQPYVDRHNLHPQHLSLRFLNDQQSADCIA